MAVSVIMPMYRPGRFIHEAIDSIVAEAKPGTEIIVVDDGSKDGTAESIEERGFQIYWFSDKTMQDQHRRETLVFHTHAVSSWHF